MGKAVRLERHLTCEELGRRYREAPDPISKTHWHVLWLVAQGRPTREIVEILGLSRTWVFQLLGRYNRKGLDALGDLRRHNRSARPLLTAEQIAELEAALAGPAPGGGLWNSRSVAEWISGKIGRPVREQRGWEYLRRSGMSPQQPRPQHTGADPGAQQDFKRNSRVWSKTSDESTLRRRLKSGPRTTPDSV